MAPTREGNTRVSAVKYWTFTLNNPKEHKIDSGSLGSILSKLGWYQFGEEIGEQGTPHFQGFIQLRKKGRPMELVKIPQIHWEKAMGSERQNMTYTGKSGKIHTNMDIVLDPLSGKELYPWQKAIMEECELVPDDRKINWIVDVDGCKGKSALQKHMKIKYGDTMIKVGGDAKDCKFAVANLKRHPKIIVWNLARSAENHISYTGIEDIKDGYFNSSKYESKEVLMNSPHIFIFSNSEPIYEKMTKDKWNIIYI